MNPKPPSSRSKPPSSHSKHSAPSLARRAMPVMALGSLAGVMVFALDRPAHQAAASTDGSTGVVADDTGSGDTSLEAGATDRSSVDSTVPDGPGRQRADSQATDTTDASADTRAPSRGQNSQQQSTKQTTASTVKKTATTTKSTSAPKATTAATSGSSCRAYKGPTVSTRFGPFQVKASVSSSGKICSVSVLQHPTGRRSDNINSQAIPILNSRAMSAQSAQFNSVSGATVSSGAYKQSLQAIIDAAKG